MNYKKRPVRNNAPRLIFVIGITIALLIISCESDKTTLYTEFHNPLAHPENGPPAGNPDGNYPVPLEAGPEAVTTPDHIIGNGTPESCNCDAFIEAVAQGGRIVFNCGPDPVTITLDRPAKVFNDAKPV